MCNSFTFIAQLEGVLKFPLTNQTNLLTKHDKVQMRKVLLLVNHNNPLYLRPNPT